MAVHGRHEHRRFAPVAWSIPPSLPPSLLACSCIDGCKRLYAHSSFHSLPLTCRFEFNSTSDNTIPLADLILVKRRSVPSHRLVLGPLLLPSALCFAAPAHLPLRNSWSCAAQCMLLDQVLFVTSTLGSFFFCFALVKIAIWYIPGAKDSQVIANLDTATSIMDPNAILAFVVGLVASIGVLIYITSGSECRLVTFMYCTRKTDDGFTLQSRSPAWIQRNGKITSSSKRRRFRTTPTSTDSDYPLPILSWVYLLDSTSACKQKSMARMFSEVTRPSAAMMTAASLTS